MDIDWPVLGKVLFKVCAFFVVIAFWVGMAMLAMAYMGKWSLLSIPLFVVYLVIKHMYHDELVRQGKRLH